MTHLRDAPRLARTPALLRLQPRFAMSRTARIQRQTAETDIELELTLDGVGPGRRADGRRLSRPHARRCWPSTGRSTCASPPRATCTSTSTTRSKTSGICLGQALRAGPRRQGGHPPLRALHAADGRDAGHRRPSTSAAGTRWRSTPRCPRRRSAPSTASCSRTSGRRSPANCLCNLHVLLHYGRNSHHIAEAVFKATARALRMAVEPDPRMTGVPSTKGTLDG